MKTHAKILYAIVACSLLRLVFNPTPADAVPVSANSITNNANVVGVFFDPGVSPPSATDITNYTVYNKVGVITITNITLDTSGQYATLQLASNVGEFFYVDVTNVMDFGGTNTFGNVSCYLRDFGNSDIGTVGDPSPAGSVFSALTDKFEISASGSDIGGTNDHFRFLYQDATGNFDMAAYVSSFIANDPSAKAGLMARENLTPGSQTIQTYITPVTGSNEVEVAVRTVANGSTTDTGFQIGPRAAAAGNSWLRMTRIGDTFTAYHGSNGVNWTVSGITTQAFSTNLFLGMAVTSHTNGDIATATFESFDAYCARPGDTVIPSLTVSVIGTNLAFDWPRTPRDFTVQISTNLTYWEYLLAPIFETGTNASGRQMLVPLDFSTNQIYGRLTRAERVIPDPPLALQTGIILTMGNCSLFTTLQNTLPCSPDIEVTDAVALTRLVAPQNTTVTFSTVDSSSDLDTVMNVHHLPYSVDYCDDNSAGNLKSKRTFTTTNVRTNFSMVIGVKPSTPVTPTKQIRLKMVIE